MTAPLVFPVRIQIDEQAGSADAGHAAVDDSKVRVDAQASRKKFRGSRPPVKYGSGSLIPSIPVNPSRNWSTGRRIEEVEDFSREAIAIFGSDLAFVFAAIANIEHAVAGASVRKPARVRPVPPAGRVVKDDMRERICIRILVLEKLAKSACLDGVHAQAIRDLDGQSCSGKSHGDALRWIDEGNHGVIGAEIARRSRHQAVVPPRMGHPATGQAASILDRTPPCAPGSTSRLSRQIRHRTGDLGHAMKTSRRPAEPVGHLLEQRARRLGQAQARLDLRRAEQGVGHALARQLAPARLAHARRPAIAERSGGGAAALRMRPSADGSSSAGRNAGTSICMSMRSSSGPDSRAW